MLCRPRNAGKGGKCDAMKITNAFQCIHLQIAFRSKYIRLRNTLAALERWVV